MIHLDSSFLVDLAREIAHERPGAAFELIESLDTRELLAASVFVVCELRGGAELSKRPLVEHEKVDAALSNLMVVYPDQRFASVYGRLLGATKGRGQTVKDMDLLIATSALVDDASLVTKNVKDFSRVPGLRVIGY